MSNNQPGWYADPFQRAQTRWWSGVAWTEHVGTNGQAFIDPPGDASHAMVPHAPVPQSAPAMAATVAQQPAATYAVAPAVAAAVAGSGRSAATKKLAIVGVVALLVGGLGGYYLRGDSGDAGSPGGGTPGGGASSGTLTTPLLQGLASLDSYEWSVTAITIGPTQMDRSEMAGQGAVDATLDAAHYTMTNTDSSADDPEPYTSVTESWSSSDATCDASDGEYFKEAKNPFASDIGPVMSGLFDIVVPSGDAVLVGTETIAGVSAQHYTFTIQGLGAGTGVQVDQNSGELWVAVDGGYLLKYVVNASMTSGPAGSAESEVNTITMTLQLTSVNQPVNVAMPTACG